MFDEVAHQNRFHRENFTFALEVGAFGEHGFRSAFGQQLPLARWTLDGDGHHPARKVEGDFVHFDVLIDREFAMQFLVPQDGAVEDVFQAGLEMADEVGVAQDVLVFLFEDVAIDLQDDVIHGQRARLVGAQHVHGSEVLDGIEAFDDDLLLGHGEGALGQADRHNHGQHLRSEADSHGEGEEEGLVPIVLGETVDEEDQRNHHQHEANHQPGELLDAAFKSSLDLPAGQTAGHFPKIRFRPGRDHDRRGGAALDAGAKKAEVGSLDGRDVFARVARIALLDGQGLPR